VSGLNFVEAKIPGDIFNTLDFDLNVKLCRVAHYLSSPNARHHYDDRLVHVSVINIFLFQVFQII
jgi:hypothetical protein